MGIASNQYLSANDSPAAAGMLFADGRQPVFATRRKPVKTA
jgi:hypothetical protein